MIFSHTEVRQQTMARLLRWMPLLAMLAFQPLRPSCGRADEFQCEEVAQYLLGCCGKLVVINCQYQHEVTTATIGASGCETKSTRTSSTTVEVDIKPQVSACLLGRSCEDILASGICSVSSWVLPSQCTKRTGTCHTYSSHPIENFPVPTCDEFVTCGSPPQAGLCTDYRPKAACDALEKLSCQ
jgi:hypothetical protein